MEYKKIHIPVMVKEVIQLLNINKDGIYVDATLGCGGHSIEILNRLSINGKLIGIDRDERAIECAKEFINDERAIFKKAKFSQIKEVLHDLGIEKVDGILFDLGISMIQIKDLSRGFSFYSDELLDMRMDQSTLLTAWNVVNKYPEYKLIRIFKEYGDEPFAKKIAREIISEREKKPIDTCKQLAEIVKKIIPKRGKIHPATQIFQAIRMEVNREREELQEGLIKAVELLKNNGRICIISYHSGEDRIVKTFFKEEEKKGNLFIVTKKPLVPTLEEITKNPSSRSARLRGGEKL